MATIKFLNAKGKYSDPNALHDVISYICMDSKTPSNMIGGFKVNLQDIANSMNSVAIQYKKDHGVRLRHFVLSFFRNEVTTPDLANTVATQICAYIGRFYQIAYAVHEDTQVLHIHFVFNSVSYINGYKYHGDKEEYYDLLNNISTILHSVGINCLIPVKYHYDQIHYNE